MRVLRERGPSANADGSASGWLKKFGIADDLEPADGKHAFTYDQALAQARKLARGE